MVYGDSVDIAVTPTSTLDDADDRLAAIGLQCHVSYDEPVIGQRRLFNEYGHCCDVGVRDENVESVAATLGLVQRYVERDHCSQGVRMYLFHL